jgi:hypothetical protein
MKTEKNQLIARFSPSIETISVSQVFFSKETNACREDCLFDVVEGKILYEENFCNHKF